ncbi:MAG TPA: homoserine O-succinyltransferase [Candidatus Egerieicola faecale]|uniref:Homoserine O-acetyltransferase n=1 Tax=Candidatus Egerieicola faecale TaxID=2840774 RepID=A0A9D1IQ62_9FIRM|nr:homoserine O-succinyltransferase [Candidatus Egerieicola faecale]
MPINIPSNLPARQTLEQENIFLITKERAAHQDIRPLRILILNLMPLKIETETQLLRLIANTPLQVDIELMQTASHQSSHTPSQHLLTFYRTFSELKEEFYDGLIVTGAPVEHLEFEAVDYWPELEEILEWSKTHCFSTFHICWGAQAGLYYHYGIPKQPLPEKMFGIFEHQVLNVTHPMVRGFDEYYLAPHSRHTQSDPQAIRRCPALEVLTQSEQAGINLVVRHDCRQIFVFGHSEYDRSTLANEYFRDLKAGKPIALPRHYFPQDDPTQKPRFIWRGHANLLFKNWLNIVYQTTPYQLGLFEDFH